MNKKQTYAAPTVDQVVILPQEAMLDVNSPTSYSNLAIQTIIEEVGTGEDAGVEW